MQPSKQKRRFKPSRNKQKKKKPSSKISYHFSKTHFACKRSGKLRISLGLIGALELLQSKCNSPITILKGYEDPEHLEKKDYRRNYHTLGLAADINVSTLSQKDLFELIVGIEEFKGIGINLDDNYIHVDNRKEENRVIWIEKDNNITLLDEPNIQSIFS